MQGYAVVSQSEAGADPYPYIYVNSDGSARELHKEEREYLETRFLPMDGARPYIKERYSRRNGWGDIRGFLRRSKLPRDIVVGPEPDVNPNPPLAREDLVRQLRDKGLHVTENSNGSISVRRPT